jgi:predicted transposase YbfD/YdcC
MTPRQQSPPGTSGDQHQECRSPDRGDVNQNVRGHRGIGNKSHCVRDTVYREDHGQAWAGEGPQALASLRNLATGLIRRKNQNAIKETTQWVSRDPTRAFRFMTT